jgi:hypothetical protein
MSFGTRGLCVSVLAATLTLVGAQTTAAQEVTTESPVPLLAATAGLPPFFSVVQPPQFEPSQRVINEAKRPAALVPLYGSMITLQALDIHSTTRALDSGRYREANPLMSGVVNNKGAFVAVKVAATTGVILLTEKMWKKHRAGAVIFAAAANSALAMVVAHNYRTTR